MYLALVNCLFVSEENRLSWRARDRRFPKEGQANFWQMTTRRKDILFSKLKPKVC